MPSRLLYSENIVKGESRGKGRKNDKKRSRAQLTAESRKITTFVSRFENKYT